MQCIVCYEDVESELNMITEHSDVVSSQLCFSCIAIIINERLDSYIEQMNNETCPRASFSMMKNGLPEFLTIDGSLCSTKVISFVHKQKVYSGKLKSNKTDEDIMHIKEEIASVVFAIENDG